MISKPMKAATVHSHEFDKIEWPVLTSPKLDGIRCLIHPELGPVTISFKEVPNRYIHSELVRMAVAGAALDGELIAIDEHGEALTFNETQSAVMSHGGQPLFSYVVFDCFNFPELPFWQRLNIARVLTYDGEHMEHLEHHYAESIEEFKSIAAIHLQRGYEGTMMRDPNGPYKSGRSTLNQGWLVKYKEWADAEGTVVDFEERMHNSNEDVRDNLGYAKRSSAKEGMVPMDTLGALTLSTDWGTLSVGSGLDDALRQEIWNEKSAFLGRTVTFKYQAFGSKDKPRFPIFKGFRESE